MKNGIAETIRKRRAEQEEHLNTYARGDRSDPFVRSRGLAHIKAGMCDDVYEKGGVRKGGYSAKREIVGDKVSYSQMARP